MRATRKAGDVPCAAEYCGAYNAVAVEESVTFQAMDVSIR